MDNQNSWGLHSDIQAHAYNSWIIVLVTSVILGGGLAFFSSNMDQRVRVMEADAQANNAYGYQQAQQRVPSFVSIPDRAKHASLVISGNVLKTSASYETIDVGKVIMTHATVAVSGWLKGNSSGTITVDLLGGTAPDGMTMRATHEPDLLNAGEQAVLFLQAKGNGHFAPAETDLMGKEGEVMKLSSSGTTEEGNLTSAQVKDQLGGAQ
jgi:hypothetical protein